MKKVQQLTDKSLDVAQAAVCKHCDLFLGFGVGILIAALLTLTTTVALIN